MKVGFKPFTKRLIRIDKYIRKLLRKLSAHVVYHNFNHTLHSTKGVVAVANKLALLENINNKDRELLCVAAYFHDVGFVTGKSDGHEERGAKLAREKLPEFGYSGREISKICDIILVTQMRKKPKTKCEKIIKDADIDNLGREDFFERGELLRKEFKIGDKKKWYVETIALLGNHKWKTFSQQNLRGKQMKKNLEKLKLLIDSL